MAQPYLKMHLCFQQLLVELRVLQDVVPMANTLGLQDINCLESTGKVLRASGTAQPCLPRAPIPLQVQPHPRAAPAMSLSSHQIRAHVPRVHFAVGLGRTWMPQCPGQGPSQPVPVCPEAGAPRTSLTMAAGPASPAWTVRWIPHLSASCKTGHNVLLCHPLQQGQPALGLALLSQQGSCAKSPQITSLALQGLQDLGNVTYRDT